MSKVRTLCVTDLARDFGRAVGNVMAEAGIPDTPQGRKVAVLTMLGVASSLIADERDEFALRDYFAYCCQKDEAAKQGIIKDLLGADVVREEHMHFVVNFEEVPTT